ncbi:N-formylglutamate deformylase [Oceanicola granulosus HTCC2516]|uniref:N-formylglutamate deformylase n=1 Tax=Oceanicola granulosus (strain ATCC BAA-861 / DSM 15982 / KCTC 12143 / HTCC2516) TaxID=314256 RepID=Q2CIA7_OCEGH|nr:N-formylglutamate deformylase [Oceanicola granulosus]EAR52351.1 N-formylglutamate deformylase [Oceanicola granulosus HTCC2516]
MKPVEITRGDGPVVLGLPHTGTWLPGKAAARLSDRGRALADTDWHVERLYADLLPGATTVRATFHRYLIDANRAPSGESLYPEQNTTDLVPVTDFEGEDIVTEAASVDEVAERLQAYHRPYHDALAAQLERVRARHGVAILFDCHSIRSRLPFLFEGTLPDLNIGTDGGTTCDPAIEAAVVARAEASGYSHVLNGRFRGGWTTRHYGRPDEGFHAIQLELAQSTYLADEAPPWRYDEAKAARLRPVLAAMLQDLADLAPSLGVAR